MVPSPTVTDVGEVTVIDEGDWQAPRPLRASGLSKAKIARQLGYDVKTMPDVAAAKLEAADVATSALKVFAMRV